MALSLDELMPLIEASPLLDQVEAALHKTDKKEAADKLLKLQQDAGIDVQKSFGIYDPKAGSQTAGLDSAYQEVTAARFNSVLRESCDALPEGDLKNTIGMLVQRLTIPEAPSGSARQRKPGMH